MLAACEPWSIALAQPDLGVPAEVLDDLGVVVQSPWQGPTHVGGISVGPGACNERATGLGSPGVGEGALTASRPTGIC
jgi:hypothetical protein